MLTNEDNHMLNNKFDSITTLYLAFIIENLFKIIQLFFLKKK